MFYQLLVNSLRVIFLQSNSYTGLVGIFCHEIAEYFVPVEEFTVQTLLRL